MPAPGKHVGPPHEGMYPRTCTIKRADSLAAAAEMVADHGPEAHVLAGGQSLIPLMKQRLATPDVLVNVSHLETPGIRLGPDRIRIHALTTHAMVEDHAELSARVDVIDDAMPQLADRQVRNMGTVGGGLAEADPGNDWGPMLLAVGGRIHTVCPTGVREIAVNEFFEGPFTTALGEAELIEAVSFPVPGPNTGGAYLKKKRRQGVYGVAAVGVQVTMADGRCESIGIGIVDDVQSYVHPTGVQEFLTGRALTDDRVAEAAERITQVVEPKSDNRGTAAYKRNLCGTLFERAVSKATARATTDTPHDD